MKRLSGIIGKGVLWLLLACLVTPLSAVAAAEDELDESRHRLDQIQQQIEETLKGLRSKKSESGALSGDLERLNVETRRIERLAKSSNRQLSDLSDQLEKQQQALLEIETLDQEAVLPRRQSRSRLPAQN